MRHILIFSTNYYPFVGGAEVAIKEITDRLAGEGFSFDMIAPRMTRTNASCENIGSVRVYRVGLGMPLDKFLIPFFGTIRALSLHKKTHYDIAWSMMASQASIAAAFFKTRRKHIPLVLTLQEGDEEEHLKRYVFGSDFLYQLFIKPWHLLVFKKADKVTAISNYLVERATANGIPRERAVLIPNGVDMEKFNQQPTTNNQQLKGKFGIMDGEKLVVTTSRLVKKNAVGDLIDALKYFPENVKIVIAGNGPEEETLKAKAHKFRGRVKFLGFVSHDDLPALLSASDVFVRPSLSEGMGNSFIEAMAAGVPVVGTKVGGIPDFLTHEETGLFCAAHDPKSIADQVVRLLKDEALRDRIIANAQKMVTDRYNWNTIAKQMKERIFDILHTEVAPPYEVK